MAYTHRPGNDASTSGDFVREPGLYHFLVVKVDEAPTDQKGIPIQNCAFEVTFQVITSSVDGQANKTFRERFNLPKPDDSDKAVNFKNKIIDRFFLATNLMSPDAIGSGSELQIELQSAVNQQVLMKLSKSLNKQTNKEYTNMDGANIFHIDDAEAKGYPRDAGAVELIPANFRRAGGNQSQAAAVPPPPVAEDTEAPF